MKLEQIASGLLLAALAASAPAQSVDGSHLTGQVERIYVRESRNLFIEKKLVRKPEQRELWAEVRIENPLRGEYVTELAQLPENVNIEHGDLVDTRITDATLLGVAQFSPPTFYAVPSGPAPLPEVNRVTALLAKHDTLRAMLFGLNNPARRQSLVAEAQTCLFVKPTAIAYSATEMPPISPR
jgi:hypothetical protein